MRDKEGCKVKITVKPLGYSLDIVPDSQGQTLE